jgi:2'-5'-oligoadenylate synthetase 1, domain 2, C-terminus
LTRPFLLDPCDPFHNIGSYFDWTELAKAAEETAKSARLAKIKPLDGKLEDMFQNKMAPVRPPNEDDSYCSIM